MPRQSQPLSPWGLWSRTERQTTNKQMQCTEHVTVTSATVKDKAGNGNQDRGFLLVTRRAPPGAADYRPVPCSLLCTARPSPAQNHFVIPSSHHRKWRGTKEPLDESERGEWKSWLKAQHSENKDRGMRSHHFMANRWGSSGNSVRLYFGGSKITADGDCSHEIKRRFLLGRKLMTNLDSILKSRDITLPTKVRLVKAMAFPVVMYRCEKQLDYKESWAPKNWCFCTVVLEKSLESPLDCKEMQPVHSKGDQL